MLGLLNVKGYDNLDWMNEYMTPSGAFYPFNTPILFSNHSIASPYENQSLTMAYRAGPVLYKINPNDPDIDIVGTYTQNLDPSVTRYQISGEPAIVAGSYGQGRVVLFAVHPEYSAPETPGVDDVDFLLSNALQWALMLP